MLGVGDNGAGGKLGAGAGGCGGDKKSGRMDVRLGEIFQHFALVKAEHVYGLAHVYCAATADGDNAVTAVFTGEVGALIYE